MRPPVLLAFRQPVGQRLLKRGQLQEVVFRAAQLRRRARRPRARLDQLHRVQLPTAGVALIAPRARVAAVRAGPLDVAIGQKAPRLGVVEQLLRRLVEMPVLQQLEKQLVRHLAVVLGHRRCERVERDAHPLPGIEDRLVKLRHHLLRAAPLLIGPHRDRRPVRVRARHHRHPIAANPVIPREDVRRQIRAAQLPVVNRPIRIGPGDADENAVGHDVPLSVTNAVGGCAVGQASHARVRRSNARRLPGRPERVDLASGAA